jgi:isopenicillin N synthase-like dioxygenase
MSSTDDLDRAPVAPAGALGGVPVIDLADGQSNVIRMIAAACRDWGFFQVIGHGIAANEIEEVIANAKAYFALPREAKRLHERSRENPWGFYDRELTKEQRDRKEVFDIGPDAGGRCSLPGDPFEGHTPWPAEPAKFQAVMRDWFEKMNGLSSRLLDLIGEGLGDEEGALANAFGHNHTSYLRLNFYPIGDDLAEEMGSRADLGIHHHTDAGALTVLLQDRVGGLQVYHDRQWHNVEPLPDAFTINIGDMVQVWSNDLYRAPLHRVLAMDRSERISIPYFYNPSYSADIRPLASPAHYLPISWGEFRRRRADGDFANYGTEVQISGWKIADA